MPCFVHFFPVLAAQKLLKSVKNLTDLQSHVRCYVLGITAKM